MMNCDGLDTRLRGMTVARILRSHRFACARPLTLKRRGRTSSPFAERKGDRGMHGAEGGGDFAWYGVLQLNIPDIVNYHRLIEFGGMPYC